jgi:hypothetical protein
MSLHLENSPLRLIVERGTGDTDWLACLESDTKSACGGASIIGAVRRWLDVHKDRFPGPYAAVMAKRESTLDRHVVLLTATTTCPSCNGSGQYVGLVHVEQCQTCAGSGLVSTELSVP